ncbi:MAG: long-chain fatty acid--CoA ligase, partial [Synechococcaceae bacterium WBA_3_309]|nr:long-chain fatty acid--CoA ligase [Synechococcaceae bacterium WBA_3_309]
MQQICLAKGDLKEIAFVLLLHGEAVAEQALAEQGFDAQDCYLPAVYSWLDFLALGAGACCNQPFEAATSRLATVLYTSGTTGRPKGVPLSQANL